MLLFEYCLLSTMPYIGGNKVKCKQVGDGIYEHYFKYDIDTEVTVCDLLNIRCLCGAEEERVGMQEKINNEI